MHAHITPQLWFPNQAEAAAELYCSIFPDSRILSTRRYENTGPDRDQTVITVEFEVAARESSRSTGSALQARQGVLLLRLCDTQAEVDEYWEKLTADGGEEGPCGWLKDRYGLSWQIIPKLLDELLQDEDEARRQPS